MPNLHVVCLRRAAMTAAVMLTACQSPGVVGQAEASPSPMPPATTTPPPAAAIPLAGMALARATVLLGGRRIQVEIAEAPESRRQGLSGRGSLAEDTGLILAWPEPEPEVLIWMPEMRFGLDVIFVRGNKIVAIFADRQPCPDLNHCPTFGPHEPVDYVLEVPAGTAVRLGAKPGDLIGLTR